MSNDRPSFLLVDGNNILHAWEDLAALLRRFRNAARAELVRLLTDWSDDADERVVLVFDGGGASPRDEVRERRIQIIHGASGETADSIIERLALKYAETYRLVVATDDLAVRDLAEAAGAEGISADALRDRIEAGRRARARWIERHRRRKD
jgi:predicted RNA-binding protein with PIN domain